MSNESLPFACELAQNSNLYKNVIELGVCWGTTLEQLRQLLPEQYHIFGFDSFQGLSEDWADLKKGCFDTGGYIPNIVDVIIYDGYFEETLPKYISEHSHPISLIHIDCDLYSSTIYSLSILNHLIQPGTVLAFDEWYYLFNSVNADHEAKAFYEWCEKYGRKAKQFTYPNGTNYIQTEKTIWIITE